MTAPTSLLCCFKCDEPFPPSSWNMEEMATCVRCGTKFHALVFPAILRKHEGSAGEVLLQEQEAGCFYHAAKKAVTVCDGCGVFLCTLCDIQLKEQHLCPRCIEKGKTRGKMKDLENQRVLYDNMATRLTIWPLIIFFSLPFWIFTAPTAIFIAVWYWKSPGSLIPQSKLRVIIAILIAMAQTVIWIAWIYYITHSPWEAVHHG